MKYRRKLSGYFLPTLKEDPREADIVSHRLMVRAGLIRKISSGIYELLPAGWRVVRKIEKIIREEMDSIGAQEMMMSALQPRGLWEESGRWNEYGPELFRLKDRKKRDFCLGPTHEEVITKLAASEISSYKELPFTLYQFQMKFRDEIRPRFGVMRAREFYMKDAYSFDYSMDGCRKSYENHVDAYKNIFKRCGLDFAMVEAATGSIGGKYSHEFMVTADNGEDEIALCSCGFGANSELAPYRIREEKTDSSVKQKRLEKVKTPRMRTVEEVSGYLSLGSEIFIKTLVYDTEKGPVVALIKGDDELNENFLKEAAGVSELKMADEETIQELTGGPPGFSGPLGVNPEYIFADRDVLRMENGVSGANEKDAHLLNINYPRDYKVNWKGPLRKVKTGDLCQSCGGVLELKRGIEVGHTFLLGKKYSSALNAVFTDEKGISREMIMGCYGIGVTRIAAAAIEQHHDKDGIVWPPAIAPFDVVLIQLGKKTSDICKEMYKELGEKYDVLWDDRDETPGVKFKDALLVGIPVHIIIGKKYLSDKKLEIQYRNTGEKEFLHKEEIEERLGDILGK